VPADQAVICALRLPCSSDYICGTRVGNAWLGSAKARGARDLHCADTVLAYVTGRPRAVGIKCPPVRHPLSLAIDGACRSQRRDDNGGGGELPQEHPPRARDVLTNEAGTRYVWLLGMITVHVWMQGIEQYQILDLGS